MHPIVKLWYITLGSPCKFCRNCGFMCWYCRCWEKGNWRVWGAISHSVMPPARVAFAKWNDRSNEETSVFFGIYCLSFEDMPIKMRTEGLRKRWNEITWSELSPRIFFSRFSFVRSLSSISVFNLHNLKIAPKFNVWGIYTQEYVISVMKTLHHGIVRVFSRNTEVGEMFWRLTHYLRCNVGVSYPLRKIHILKLYSLTIWWKSKRSDYYPCLCT